MARLDLQRAPGGRYHVRGNNRNYRRGYDTNPHAVWGSPESQTGGGTVPSTATLTSISPTTAAAEAGATTVTCTGTGFATGCTMYYRIGSGSWTAVATTRTSATSCNGSIVVAGAGSYSVVVVNPGETPTTPKVLTVS